MALLVTVGVAQASGEKFGIGLFVSGGLSGAGIGLAVQYDEYKGVVSTGGISADKLMYRGDISAVKGLSYFAGPGAYVAYSPALGLRAAFGLDYNINKNIDLYTEIVPNVGLTFASGVGLDIGVSGGFGARYFF